MAKIQRDATEKRLLFKSLLWSFPLGSSMNVAKMQAHGFCSAMLPWLKHLYKEKHPDEFKAAMVRHTVFFNTNNTMCPFVVGMTAAMEKERERTLGTEDELDETLIQSMKVSLQGTLAGLGDALMFNTVRVIATGVAAPLCTNGTILGPLMFMAIQLGVQIAIRTYLVYLGYDVGMPFLDSVVNGGISQAVSSAAATLGLIMIGSMVASTVRVSIRTVITMGEVTLEVQKQVFDAIMPNMLPLALLVATVMLLRKGLKITSILLMYMAACILLGIVGVL